MTFSPRATSARSVSGIEPSADIVPRVSVERAIGTGSMHRSLSDSPPTSRPEPYRVFRRLNYVTLATVTGASRQPGTIHHTLARRIETAWGDIRTLSNDTRLAITPKVSTATARVRCGRQPSLYHQGEWDGAPRIGVGVQRRVLALVTTRRDGRPDGCRPRNHQIIPPDRVRNRRRLRCAEVDPSLNSRSRHQRRRAR